MTDCIFCRIASREIPAEVVADDGEFVAFKDLHALAPVHLLVVPKQHLESLNDVASLPLEAAGRMVRFIAAAAQQSGAGESGYRVIANNGADAGQEVQHLHWHIIGGAPLGGMV